jgi:hypothetical protein
MSHAPNVVRTATNGDTVRCGPGGPLGRLAGPGQPDWSLAARCGSGIVAAMAFITPHRRAPRLGMLVSGSVYGALLAAAGLGIAYLAVATPLVTVLATDRLSGTSRPPIGLGILSLSLIAGGALLLAGTNRLAATLAGLKNGPGSSGATARALSALADQVAVVANVVPNEGRAIPELVIGPFGAAVIHVLPAGRRYRQVGTSWEYRTRDGWLPTENPLDQANRDAERVRRWFTIVDLDFVVRVYAALVVNEGSVSRSVGCAVVTADQLPAWIGALPAQRSLTAARRLRLRTLATSPAAPMAEASPRGW